MSILVDNFNRRIEYLRISITDRCNLRCRYCMPESGIDLMKHEDILRYEEIIRIVHVFAALGISKIRITGGEPLVRQGVVDLIGRIHEIQGIQDLSLTTNGILLEPFARNLYAAGLRRVNISLDSLKPEKFRYITRRNGFHRVWGGIERSLREGFHPIKLNIVAIKGVNDDEIVDFARLTQNRPIHVRFIEYMPTGKEVTWKPEDVLTVSRIKQEIERFARLVEVTSEGQNGPAAMYRLEGAQGLIGFISPVSRHFCGKCNRLRLTSDGKLRTCLFCDDEIDLREYLRNGCGDEKLIERLRLALGKKPQRHEVNTQYFKKCQRNMNSIGG